MRVVGIVQARLGSTRLPNKVLAPIDEHPMLFHVIERLQRANSLDKIVVATSFKERDMPIVEFCNKNNWLVFCGNEEDVLDRYYHAALEHEADIIVRVTSDCPLIDPALTDQVVNELVRMNVNYCSNTYPHRTFPRGLDVEALTMHALTKAFFEDCLSREHVTGWIHRNKPFQIWNVVNDEDSSYMRWTVDEEPDLELVRTIYRHFGNNKFGWKEAVQAMKEHPEWGNINAGVRQKEI